MSTESEVAAEASANEADINAAIAAQFNNPDDNVFLEDNNTNKQPEEHQINEKNESKRENSPVPLEKTSQPADHLDHNDSVPPSLDTNEPIKKEPPKPTQRQSIRPPTSSRSLNFTNNTNKLTRSCSNFSLANPHLCSVNDFKYMGDQFKVGKIDPALKASHEIRFQKMWKPRLEKLTNSSSSTSMSALLSTPRKDIDVVKDYKRTKNDALLSTGFNLNDFKFTGNQFRVGKIDPKLQTTTEKRFQSAYRKRLEKLMPNWEDVKQVKPLNYQELKEIHNQLAVVK